MKKQSVLSTGTADKKPEIQPKDISSSIFLPGFQELANSSELQNFLVDLSLLSTTMDSSMGRDVVMRAPSKAKRNVIAAFLLSAIHAKADIYMVIAVIVLQAAVTAK